MWSSQSKITETVKLIILSQKDKVHILLLDFVFQFFKYRNYSWNKVKKKLFVY